MNKILYNGQVIIDLDELADKYTKAEVDALVSSVFKYKGTVATKADLNNIVDMKIGDCYNVEADGVNYAWNGEEWGALSGTVDLTNYYTKEQVDGKFGSYLPKNNTTEYTPTSDYNPATKKYVDDNVKNAIKYKLYRIDNDDELSTNDFSIVFMNWLNANVVPNLTANPWDTVYIDVNASNTDYVSGIYRVEYDSSTGADYNLMFINVDNDNRFVGFIDSTPNITELFFSKSNKNVLELNGTYNDIDVTPGYDFSIDEVNALISKIDYTQSSININLERDFGTRVHSNKIIGCIGFNETTYTDETAATQEVSLSFITVSDGAYLRFYGSAALTNGAITSVLHCYSEDYNG